MAHTPHVKFRWSEGFTALVDARAKAEGLTRTAYVKQAVEDRLARELGEAIHGKPDAVAAADVEVADAVAKAAAPGRPLRSVKTSSPSGYRGRAGHASGPGV